jgi:hypothetical protein
MLRLIARDVFAALRRVLRLLIFRRVDRDQSAPGIGGVSVLLVLNLAGMTLVDAIDAGESLQFNSWGIVDFFAALGVFAGAFTVLGSHHAPPPLRRALADLLGVNFIGTLLFAGGLAIYSQNLLSGGFYALPWSALFFLLIVWLLLACWRAGRAIWPHPLRFRGLRFVSAVAVTAALVPYQEIVWGDMSSLWRPDAWDAVDWAYRSFVLEDQSAASASRGDWYPKSQLEDTLYRQPEMMAAELAKLTPSDPVKPQYFLLAAAPYGGQDVFSREVTAVQQLFDERFGTRGHSAVLASDGNALTTRPLANTKNIEMALKGIGKLMNRDKDVLVLFITSHGAEGIVSVGVNGLPLNQITPDSLKRGLDAAAIKNRVLIISSCHAGSFIPALENPNTLVIAAAAADRTSFGCANGREWTYFGDALFNHALREETSFIAAFGKAKALIERWEFWRSLMWQKPSNPQMSVGAEIEKALATFQPAGGQRAEAVIDLLRKSDAP